MVPDPPGSFAAVFGTTGATSCCAHLAKQVTGMHNTTAWFGHVPIGEPLFGCLEKKTPRNQKP